MAIFTDDAVKNFDQLVTDIVTFIDSRAPFADLGADEIYRDVLVEAPASELSDNWQYLQFLSNVQSLDNILNADNDTEYKTTVADATGLTVAELQTKIDGFLDNWGANFGMTRNAAVAATGTATFYTETQPTENINVPQGSIVSTEAEVGVPSVLFETTRDATLTAGNADAFFNVETGFYELGIPIVAQIAGKDGNVPAGTIVSVQSTTIPMRVTNRAVTTRGADQESNTSWVSRIKDAFISNFHGTKSGLEQTVRETSALVLDALAAGTGDLLQARGAGSVDIYIIGSSLANFEETFTFANRADSYVLTSQPAESISSIVGSLTGTISSAYYSLQADTGTRAGSITGQDAVVWTPASATKSSDSVYGYLTAPTVLPSYVQGDSLSARIFVFRDGILETSLWEYADDTTNQNKIRTGADTFDSLATYTILLIPESSDELTINYWYNGLINTLQTIETSDENQILGQHLLLVKEATEVPVDVTLTVEINSSTTVTQARSDVQTVITSYLETNTLGGEVRQSAIIDAIEGDVTGVINVQVPFAKLARSGETGAADITIASNEYSSSGAIVVNVIQL